MKTKYCQNPGCGIELTPENAYSRSGERFRPYAYCKICDNKLKQENYKKRRNEIRKREIARYDATKKYTLVLRRGIYSTRVVFDTYLEKQSFQVQRKAQIRFGRCHSSRSSPFDQRTEELVERKIGKKTYRFYEAAECNECHSEIRSGHNGNKICTECGLLREGAVIDHSQPNEALTRAVRINHGAVYNYDMLEEVPPEEVYSTFDFFYARAYSKRLK